MPYQISRAVEYVGDGILSGFGNIGWSSIAGGFDITYSGANLTFNVAQGAGTVNKLAVSHAAQTNVSGIVSDTTYSTWEWIRIDSAGVASVQVGDPAADPAVPSIDYTLYTPIALLLVPKNTTIANSITVKLDKRIYNPVQVSILTGGNFSKSTSTLQDVPGWAFYLPASGAWRWEADAICTAAPTPGIKFGATGPAGVTVSGYGVLYEAASSESDASSTLTAGTIDMNPVTAGIAVHLVGYAIGDATHPGTVQIQMAQETTDASATILFAVGATFIARQIT